MFERLTSNCRFRLGIQDNLSRLNQCLVDIDLESMAGVVSAAFQGIYIQQGRLCMPMRRQSNNFLEEKKKKKKDK